MASRICELNKLALSLVPAINMCYSLNLYSMIFEVWDGDFSSHANIDPNGSSKLSVLYSFSSNAPVG